MISMTMGDAAFKNVYADDDRAPVHHVTGNKLGLVVAKAIDEDQKMETDEIIANAQLIASAPCLYEALKDCVAVLTDDVVGTYRHDDPDWYQALNKAVEKARAALSKAEGSPDSKQEGK